MYQGSDTAFYFQTEQMIHKLFKAQWMQIHIWKEAAGEIRSLRNFNLNDWSH